MPDCSWMTGVRNGFAMAELRREAVARRGASLKNVAWWFVFTISACWFQTLLPGVDFLVAGLVASLQEGRWQQTVCLAVVWIFIQEGAGSLPFGSGLLWYAIVAILFSVCTWLFETKNLFFVLLFGVALGIWHYSLVQMMASLQDYQFAPRILLLESCQQTVVFVLAWHVTYKLRQQGYL